MKSRTEEKPASFPTLLLAAGMATAFYATPVAWAEDPIALVLKTCTAQNCESAQIVGRINANATSSNPWVGQFWAYSTSSVCLRFHVDSQVANTEMSVVAPGGAVHTSDNAGGPCPTCPKVVIGPLIPRGVYTVVLNSADGTAKEAGFRIRAALYPQGNPNCAGPTPGSSPLLTTAEKLKERKAGLR